MASLFKNRFMTVFISVFAAVTLLFGGILGTIVAVGNARAVVRCDKVSASEGAINYLSANYKIIFIKAMRGSSVNAADVERFWNSTDKDGRSYREIYLESFKEYVSAVVSSANVYMSYSEYTAEDKESVRATAEEFLNSRVGGSVSDFNRLSEKYGFDYDDFCEAVELLYKADRAKVIIYGFGGENLKNFPEECERYLETYSHVSLLFVRTEKYLVKDENGNQMLDENGEPMLRDMTDEEKAERQSVISALDEAIEAKNSGGNMQITPEMFDIYLERSNGDPARYKKGYYFHENSYVTEEFASEFPEVVKESIEMNVGEYRKVDCSIGVCYIYKYPIVKGAYEDTEDVFFSDFYSDAADYLYGDILSELEHLVVFSDSYSELDPVGVPKLDDFVIREWR